MEDGIKYVLRRLLEPRTEMLEDINLWKVSDTPGRVDLQAGSSGTIVMSSAKVFENDFQVTLDVVDAVCMILDDAGIPFNIARQSSGYLILAQRRLSVNNIIMAGKHLLGINA